MILMLLLTELTRLDVRLVVEPDGLKVETHPGAITDEVRQAMVAHKAALLAFAHCPTVQTVDGRACSRATHKNRISPG